MAADLPSLRSSGCLLGWGGVRPQAADHVDLGEGHLRVDGIGRGGKADAAPYPGAAQWTRITVTTRSPRSNCEHKMRSSRSVNDLTSRAHSTSTVTACPLLPERISRRLRQHGSAAVMGIGRTASRPQSADVRPTSAAEQRLLCAIRRLWRCAQAKGNAGGPAQVVVVPLNARFIAPSCRFSDESRPTG